MEIIRDKNIRAKRKISLPPPVVIMLSFLAVIIAGSLLLALPFSRNNPVRYIDSLFTSVSAVCVTGLVTLNISTDFTLIGQIIILALIQVGGLGFMTLTAFFFIFVGKKITLKERLIISEAFNEENLQGLVKLTILVIIFTAVIETAGAVFLAFVFVPEYGWGKGIFFSVFHSVSAFCNAGLDVTGSSFINYKSNVILNISVMSLIFFGGLGFGVLKDIYVNKKLSKFSFNTKVVLFTSLFLILTSAGLYALLEWDNAGTLGGEGVPGKILGSFFQAVTTRTAGFNTVDQSQLTSASKLITVVNMFIGASPASTGGGIKTTTAFMAIALFISGLRGQDREVTVFGKGLSLKSAHKTVLILIYSVTAVALFTFLVFVSENGNKEVSGEALFFEVVSAFGTVGLSYGITPHLNVVTKVLLIVLMYIGRLGALVLSLFFFQSRQKELLYIKHPEARIMIG